MTISLFLSAPPAKMADQTSENNDVGTVSDLSDTDILIQYCLQNKVNKTAVDELLKRGFDSLDALKLVNMEDLSSQHIPMGQRRLIFHIAKALGDTESTSGSTTSVSAGQSETATATPTAGGNTGVSQLLQSVGATSASQPNQSQSSTIAAPLAGNTGVSQALPGFQQQQTNNVNNNVYNQTLLNTLLSQQAQLATSGLSSNSTNSVNVQTMGTVNQAVQPSWNDPQIHIASATGKLTSTYYDICDFVPHSLDEDLVVGGQGEQQLVIKSGPKKPKLESLTLSQWSIANLAILYKLVNEGKLVGPSLMDYLSYTTKVYQLVQRFSLVSVLLYDREYRKLQGSMSYRWGTDVQHLHTLFLQPRPNGGPQGNTLNIPKRGNANQTKPKVEKRTDVCRNFNSEKGCSYDQCKFRHKCMVPGCGQSHSAISHSREKK